jgi:acyl carrier protein
MDKRLASVLAEIFRMPESEIHVGLTKKDVGNWDSLKQMDLVLSLENEFGLTLAISDIKRLVSVGEIIAVLREKGVPLAD